MIRPRRRSIIDGSTALQHRKIESEIDRQHLLPLGQREVPQILGRAGDADHRRQNVDVPVLGERPLHHLVHLLFVGHVGPEAQRAAARLADLRAGGRVQLLGRDQVADRQQRALGGEPPGHSLRVAARRAGDQRHLVLQSSHGRVSLSFPRAVSRARRGLR